MYNVVPILKKFLPFLMTIFLWRLSVYFWNPAGILALIPIFYYGDSNNCKAWKKMVEVNIIKNSKDENNNRFTQFFRTYKNVFDSFIYDERITD